MKDEELRPGMIVQYKDWQGGWYDATIVKQVEPGTWYISRPQSPELPRRMLCSTTDIRPRSALHYLAEAAE